MFYPSTALRGDGGDEVVFTLNRAGAVRKMNAAITTLGRCKVDLSFFHDQSTLLEGQNERNQTLLKKKRGSVS